MTLIVPEWHTWTVRERYLREVDDRAAIASFRGAFHGRAGLDALWFPFNGCSWTNFTLPAVATLHDASNFVVPDYAPATQQIFRAAAQRCRALITDSGSRSASSRGSCRLRPNASCRFRWASTRRDRRSAVALDVAALAPFVLYVGAAERRKGFDTLLAGDGAVARERPELSLVATTQLDG